MIQSNDAIAPLIRILQTLSRDEELWDWVGEDLPHYGVAENRYESFKMQN